MALALTNPPSVFVVIAPNGEATAFNVQRGCRLEGSFPHSGSFTVMNVPASEYDPKSSPFDCGMRSCVGVAGLTAMTVNSAYGEN